MAAYTSPSGVPPNVPTPAARESANHPQSGEGRFGPDEPFSFQDKPYFTWVAETTAEREGCSLDEAKGYLLRNTQSESDEIARAEWSRPRDEQIPLSRIVDEHDSA